MRPDRGQLPMRRQRGAERLRVGECDVEARVDPVVARAKIAVAHLVLSRLALLGVRVPRVPRSRRAWLTAGRTVQFSRSTASAVGEKLQTPIARHVPEACSSSIARSNSSCDTTPSPSVSQVRAATWKTLYRVTMASMVNEVASKVQPRSSEARQGPLTLRVRWSAPVKPRGELRRD